MTPSFQYVDDNAKSAIRASFSKMAPRAEELVGTFYDRLFELEPSLRPLFAADLSTQKRKLGGMLTTVIGLLDQPAKLLEAADRLGERHKAYGAAPDDFEPVGEALLYAISEVLAGDFTYDVEAAWLQLYTVLAQRMSAALQA